MPTSNEYYSSGELKDGREVVAGIDVNSCWISVLKESGTVQASGGRWFVAETGEAVGTEENLYKETFDGPLLAVAQQLVYGRLGSNGRLVQPELVVPA